MAPVPKPADAGSGNAAIADTKSTFVNVRNGPGTGYDVIGQVRDKSIVTYYPATNRDGWVWVEQVATAGWIASWVVNFNDVDVEPPKDFPPTPYDGASAIWHWKGTAIPEETIAQFIANVQKNTPNVKDIFVKFGDGNTWQGQFDAGDMAVNGPDDVARWVKALNDAGMRFHGWIVLRGEDIDGEADLIIKTANVPGVESIILDVEPYEGYWTVGPEPIRPLMTNVRNNVPARFHIGIAVDPRRAHFKSVYPHEWFPFINSVHTMSYWTTFRRSVEEVLEETYAVWGGYGKPLYPILQGTATLDDQKRAVELAVQRFNAKGVSWWRYGVIPQWGAVNMAINADETPEVPEEEPPPETAFGKEVLIFTNDEGFRNGTYTGQEEFKTAQGAYGWQYLYTQTQQTTSNVWAEWRTTLPEDGIYQIAVFIPARHSTTKKARYKIHGIRGTNTEVIVDINQSIHRNEWVPLGIFDLVKDQQNAGKVLLNDVTQEEETREIAFDAVRYRQIIRIAPEPGGGGDDEPVDPDVPVADGFDAPVGTAEERALELPEAESSGAFTLWFGQWADKVGFAKGTVPGYLRNFGAYHTGVDLNWRSMNQDLGKPVYSPASGTVIYQANIRPWGNLTVIRHDPLYTPTGPTYYSRYGHMQNVTVKVGDRVERGQQIGEVGTGGGRFVAHLHYDIAQTSVLETKPNDWPGKNLTSLERNYVDPLVFTRNHRPKNR